MKSQLKINFIYDEKCNNNINDIFVDILTIEAKKYIKNNYNTNNYLLNSTYLPLSKKEDKNAS